MNNLRIYPYALGSESARDLARILNVLRVTPDGNFIPKMGVSVINWGNSTVPNWAGIAARRSTRILNRPESVVNASNKLNTFRKLQVAGVRTPAFTTNFQEAKTWLQTGLTVVERHTLSGHSGEGIRIVSYDDESATSQLQAAPLYTKYMYKEKEFRVHVFRGTVIDYIEKKKRRGAEDMPNFDRFVYSTERGWVFSREGATQLDSVKQLAINAVRALGLDFGAVDVILVDNIPYVLEVNSSPGLMGTTLIKYANAFRQFMGAGPLDLNTVNTYMASVRGRDMMAEEVAPAAPVAQVRGTTPPPITAQVQGDLVTLRLDRNTARTLRDLLSAVI